MEDSSEREIEAAKETDPFNTIIFGYDKWFGEGKLFLTDIPDEPMETVYRGWMMKPEAYDRFYEELLQNNIKPVITPSEYSQMQQG